MTAASAAGRLKVGIIGLGNAASMILPAFKVSPDAVLGGAADTRSEV
jgi:predicted dehydrogenase